MSKPMLALIGVGGALVIILAWWFIPTGSHGQSGPSDFDLAQQARQKAVDLLSTKGARVTEKTYPIGKAYAVNLSGQTITPDLLDQLKALGHVSELDLSKSTVTDDHLGKMSQLGLTNTMAVLDLSNTGVSDEGLNRLENMIFLLRMNLAGSKCTKAGADKFRRNREAQVNIKTRNPTIKLN